MSFIQGVLLLLGSLLLIAFTVVVLVVYFGRKLYFYGRNHIRERKILLKNYRTNQHRFYKNLRSTHSFIAGFVQKGKKNKIH